MTHRDITTSSQYYHGSGGPGAVVLTLSQRPSHPVTLSLTLGSAGNFPGSAVDCGQVTAAVDHIAGRERDGLLLSRAGAGSGQSC